MKDFIKRIKNIYNNYIVKYIKIFVKFIKNNKKNILKILYILCMTLPFYLMDLSTRFLGRKIDFFDITELVPNLFTTIWIIFILGGKV